MQNTHLAEFIKIQSFLKKIFIDFPSLQWIAEKTVKKYKLLVP